MTRPTDPFRSARLIYRAVRTPDDNTLFAAINDDRIGFPNSNAANIKLPGAVDAEKYLKQVTNSLLGAVICLPATPGPDARNERPGVSGEAGTPVGVIHLESSPAGMQQHRNTEIGIDILPEYQGRGYGSEAIKWVLDYAFRRAGLHRVCIRAFEWNDGAIRLYERLGFKHEGRHREALWHEGRWWDGIDMGMLEGEWWEMQRSAES